MSLRGLSLGEVGLGSFLGEVKWVIDWHLLSRFRRRALRHRAWYGLEKLKRNVYGLAEYVLRLKEGFAKSPLLVSTLLEIIFELAERIRSMKAMIMKAGFLKAMEILERCGEREKGIFKWIPELKDWLRDPIYIEYLGVSTRTMRW